MFIRDSLEEYLEDGFADVKFFESSQRYRYEWKGISLNIGIAQRMSEPYGYDPLEEWQLSNGNLHYTQLALQEGYTVQFDGQGGAEYFDPSGNSVATSTEVWEAVVIPQVLSDYTERKRVNIEMNTDTKTDVDSNKSSDYKIVVGSDGFWNMVLTL